MKKQITLIGTTLLFSTLLGAVSASAAEKNTEANPSTVQTQVTGQLQLSENGGFNPNPPSGSLNSKTGITNSYFGIAYKPTNFSIGNNVKLADTNTEQNIVMTGQDTNNSFHVAVKDKKRAENRQWVLTAKLSSAIDQENLGISIKAGTTENSVKRNINNGTDQFVNSHLIDQVMKDNSTREVTNNTNLAITSTASEVMKALNGKFVNGVYDLKLPQVELHIPDASKVKAQTLSTNVTWTLANAPSSN